MERYHGLDAAFVVDLRVDAKDLYLQFRRWLENRRPLYLNVAGPREIHSEKAQFSIFERAVSLLTVLLSPDDSQF